MAAVKKEKKRRIRENPLKFYWPHAYGCDGKSCSTNEHSHTDYYGVTYTLTGCPQYEFHTAVSPIHTTADFGGNRSGKSTCGIVEDAFHATGQYADWYPREKQWHTATRGRIFANDFRTVQEVITPLIDEWFPKTAIKDKDKNNQGVYTKYYIKHTSNQTSTLDILTYEMDSAQCEGWHGHYVHWDEPPPRAHRAATVRGLIDYGGYEYFSLTPLKEPWIYDEVFQNPDVRSVTCDIRHNLYRPNPLTGLYIGITEENIRITESKWTQEEIQARGRGKFRFLAGRIWKIWDRQIHTFDRSMWKAGERGVRVDGEPPRHWKRAFFIDPHDNRPHALIWVALEPDYKRKFIYREAWLIEKDFPAVVEHIKDVEMEAREKIACRIMDPNFGPKMQGNTKQTVRQTFENEGKAKYYPISFSFGDDHKPLGRKKVSEMMHYDTTQPISLINRPDLMVAKDCVQCIYQVEHYVWDDYKYGERDPKEKPKDINTHFPDLLHYLALFKWDATDAEVVDGVGTFYT